MTVSNMPPPYLGNKKCRDLRTGQSSAATARQLAVRVRACSCSLTSCFAGGTRMEFHKSKAISLKANVLYDEKWLQGLLVEDPALLGLGHLIVKDVERRQPRAGRLDLLLVDPESATRYEVEIQLGATDETHIIRTIEYWDIEKTRYPQYEHVAVIVAEDITTRFLNVISLFNRAIPLIAIQMRALEVNGVLTLNATTVLDLVPRGDDEDDEPDQATDRAYWVQRGSPTSVALADKILSLIAEVSPGLSLKYTKHYIGLAKDGLADNFVIMTPRKDHVIAAFRAARSDELTELIESSGLDALAYGRRGRYRVRVTEADLSANRSVLLELVRRASGAQSASEE